MPKNISKKIISMKRFQLAETIFGRKALLSLYGRSKHTEPKFIQCISKVNPPKEINYVLRAQYP
jgi:hypothetical protein